MRVIDIPHRQARQQFGAANVRPVLILAKTNDQGRFDPIELA